MTKPQLIFQIGLTLIKGVGDVNGKKLIAYCGGPEAVFKENSAALLKIPGIGKSTVNQIKSQQVLQRAETELAFIQKFNITPLFYTDSAYPARLLNCEDGPMMLYYKGNANLNAKRIISIVGTRRATNYGKARCEEIIDELQSRDVLVVSGLAYGIDSCAHRRALDVGMDTIGVLGHGLDRIYPAQNRKMAEKMIEQGGLMTEFMSDTRPDRENFPKRNRIVAGMSDAVLVVESDRKGGALITAEIANSYNRDVFAVPGRIGDDYSRGCHFLIKTNRAALAENGHDIAYLMGWEEQKIDQKSQTELFVNLSEEQKLVLKTIQDHKEIAIDQLTIKTKLSTSKVAASLLNLEFEGFVKSLPGKLYTA
ncbi:MAG: DNA-processing protein DprA [Bacteroidales bacterium]|jgi:DNA processing protein|nr:DNA-processing protein DprA [Bacteroidales bacterium]